MAIHFNIENAPFHPYTSVDPVANKIAQIKLTVSYDSPCQLEWLMYAAGHTMPMGIGKFIQFWDDAYDDPDGNPFSDTNPIFEGWIEEVDPVDSQSIRCIARDPTSRVANNWFVMSMPWQEGVVPDTLPIIGVGAYPRLVLNGASITQDDDYAYSFGDNATVGKMIQDVLDFSYHPLYWSNAAPGDGTSAGHDNAYTDDLSGMNHIPQEKQIFEGENIRSAIDRCLQWQPTWKLLWYPGTRKWRFGDITIAPAVTVTLNQAGDNRVMMLSLTRSLEGRYTSVKAYGPPQTQVNEFYLSTGDLIPSGGIVLQTYTDGSGAHEAISYNTYQIADTSKRAGARLLPRDVYATGMPSVGPDDESGGMGIIAQNTIATRSPFMEVNFGPVDDPLWFALLGVRFDFLNGIAFFASGYCFETITPAPNPGSSQTYFPLHDARLVWASYVDVLFARAPASDYSGTAYTIANITNELSLYDEMLCVDTNEWGQQITTDARIAAFEIYCEVLLSQRQDMIHAGQIVLQNLAFDYVRLNRRINIAAVDGSGNPITTGWEAINGLLTQTEFDFDQQLTTLTLSSDQLQNVGWDPAILKELLGIRQLTRYDDYRLVGQINFNANSFVATADVIHYVDPQSGVVSEPIGQSRAFDQGFSWSESHQGFGI